MHFCSLALAVLLGAPPLWVHAQGAPSPSAADTTAASHAAVLTIFNRPIATFRAPFGASSPEERAELARTRIMALIDKNVADSVATHRAPEGILIDLANKPVFTITEADVDPILDESLEQASLQAARNLRIAIAEEQEARSLPRLIKAVALALLATVLLVILVQLLWRFHRRIRKRVEALALAAVPRISISGLTLLDSKQTRSFLARAVDTLGLVVLLFVSYVWLTFVLRRFPYTRMWGDALRHSLVTALHGFGLKLATALPGLLAVVLIVLAARFVVRLVTAFFDAIESSTIEVPWLHSDTARATRRIAVALLWVFAIMVAYPYIPGSGTDVFKGVSVFLGLVVSLGSSGAMNQAMSGLVIMYSRSFRPGELVQIGDTFGTVVDLGMLSTKIRTYKRELITIPNAVVIASRTTNYTRLHAPDGVLLSTSVTIGYDAPWRQVHSLLLMAVERTAGLRREPAPFVLQRSLSDFFVEYEVHAVIEKPHERLKVLSELHANIQDAFNEYGVQIMAPHFESQPEKPVFAPKTVWHRAPAPASETQATD